MRLLFTFFLFLPFFLRANGQPATITVDGKKFDDNLIQSIKQLQPDFGLGGDSANIIANIQKSYTTRKYIADLARTKGIDTITELSIKLSVAKQVLEERMIAEYYSDLVSKNMKFSDTEARKYYEEDIDRYTTPGTCDLIYIETSDTSKNTMTELRKTAIENAALPKQDRMSLKKYNDIYLMKNYLMYSNNKEYPFTNQIFSAKPKSWVGPLFSKDINRYVYFLIIEKQEPKITPYEEVKDVYIQNLKMIKYTELYQQWSIDALKKYPIKIN